MLRRREFGAPLADSSPPEPDAPRRKRNAEDTQRRILDAAEREFAVRGFAGARLREIAVMAEVQPALIHHYFADKRGLYEAVVRRGLDLMSRASWTVISKDSDLAGYVRGFVDVLIDFYEEHHALLAIFRGELARGSELGRSLAREHIEPLVRVVVAMAEAFQKQGAIRDDIGARELVLSALSLILYPVVDGPLIRAVLPGALAEPAESGSQKEREHRKRVVGEMILGGLRRP